MEISGSIKVDQVEIRESKEKVTQAVGYENSRLRLTIQLLPLEDEGDCSEQVRILQQLFRKSPDQEKPGVYRIVSKHAQARGINEVIFADLKTIEDNRSDKVYVIAEFTEHAPIKVTVAQKSTGQRSPAPAKQTKSTLEDFKLEKKQETPAKDTRKPGLGRRILDWLRGKDR